MLNRNINYQSCHDRITNSFKKFATERESIRLKKLSYWSLIVLLVIIVVTGTFLGAFWRLDPHHDGFTYLPAKFGEIGQFPPGGAGSNYGVAQATIEGIILNFIPDYFILYRLIAVFLILATGYFTYKIISLKGQKLNAALFALIWLYANPTWQNAINTIPLSLQAVWSNLWIQTLTVYSIYLIDYKTKISKRNITCIGIITATLPFFRFQGLISSMLILTLFFIKTHEYKFLTKILTFTIFLWLSIILMSGGLSKYFEDIFIKPSEGLVEFTSFSYLFQFGRSFLNYYLVIGSIFFTIIARFNAMSAFF